MQKKIKVITFTHTDRDYLMLEMENTLNTYIVEDKAEDFNTSLTTHIEDGEIVYTAITTFLVME